MVTHHWGCGLAMVTDNGNSLHLGACALPVTGLALLLDPDEPGTLLADRDRLGGAVIADVDDLRRAVVADVDDLRDAVITDADGRAAIAAATAAPRPGGSLVG
jgi:hypothetical protein